MKYIKAFNNNVALVEDSSGLEWIVMGTAVGFQKKKGDPIDDSSVRRKFVAEQSTTRKPLLQVLKDMDSEVLDVSVEIIKNAESHLGVSFNNNIYLTLADHLNFAVKRAHESFDYADTNRWEVKNLYPKEYQAAKDAVRLVFDRLDVLLPKSEETFLTYHFVNGQQTKKTQIEETLKMTEVINRIIEIVQYHFQLKLDEESLNYTRFITHLRYFFIRQYKQDPVDGEEMDQTLLEVVKTKYKKAYQAVDKIAALLKQKYGWTLSSNEKLYLTLHIWRVTNRQKNE
ncbi:transcriptional antiterminator, BglG family [Gracilibacillus orientalis]|uniref:Transcriptional antiterminator, BglG family n=1 Tax=Gracilibacillus orientalis TaxID=334253 RepID=A0A1I4JZU3_9BACI|nr:PRD domain-containing protein [Gracilibacillus orientalis]SFL71773.1 transcriptional antiterminator, BglG family [Gracilibacillus orientalis]